MANAKERLLAGTIFSALAIGLVHAAPLDSVFVVAQAPQGDHEKEKKPQGDHEKEKKPERPSQPPPPPQRQVQPPPSQQLQVQPPPPPPQQRAELVALVLGQQFGVPAENFTTQGYGDQYLKVLTRVLKEQTAA